MGKACKLNPRDQQSVSMNKFDFVIEENKKTEHNDVHYILNIMPSAKIAFWS